MTKDKSKVKPEESQSFSLFLLFFSVVILHHYPTVCTLSWGPSTPRSCTFWASWPVWSGPGLVRSSSSPCQTEARTISVAAASPDGWTTAWTASGKQGSGKYYPVVNYCFSKVKMSDIQNQMFKNFSGMTFRKLHYGNFTFTIKESIFTVTWIKSLETRGSSF